MPISVRWSRRPSGFVPWSKHLWTVVTWSLYAGQVNLPSYSTLLHSWIFYRFYHWLGKVNQRTQLTLPFTVSGSQTSNNLDYDKGKIVSHIRFFYHYVRQSFTPFPNLKSHLTSLKS